MEKTWRIGELARSTGLSVRTLRHYDEIGLLRPARRTESGYRLYGPEDVLRLQRILSLRSLGLPLSEVARCLDDPEFTALRVVELHAERVREELRIKGALLERLELVAERLRSSGGSSPAELVQTAMEVIEISERLERYYTPGQREYLEKRARELGRERIRRVEEEWPRLIEEVRAEMEAGTDPRSERVRELARRWKKLVEEFTGGDEGISRSLGRMWGEEEEIHGHDTARMREMISYISRAEASEDKP